jgi:hypothetical protein
VRTSDSVLAGDQYVLPRLCERSSPAPG